MKAGWEVGMICGQGLLIHGGAIAGAWGATPFAGESWQRRDRSGGKELGDIGALRDEGGTQTSGRPSIIFAASVALRGWGFRDHRLNTR